MSMDEEDSIKAFLQEGRLRSAEVDRLTAVYLKRLRQDREKLRTKAEIFLDSYFYHMGLPRTPENMPRALDACAKYLARQQAKEEREEFSPTLDKGGLMKGF